MSDYSEYTVRVSHEDLEQILRDELIEAIKSHKKEMLSYEREMDNPEQNEDYLFSKKFVNAAAIVLRWYALPDKWPELERLEKEHEV